MKSLFLFSFLLLTFPLPAQNSRYDGPGGGNNAVVAVCSSPANGVPCTNYATTYNSLGAACSNSAQDTPQPQPSNCQPTVDAKGSVGFWAPAGTYDYTVCAAGNCFGPFTVTLGSGGACAEGTCVVNAPSADQIITGAHVFWNQSRTWLGINGNANHTFGLSPDSYLFNIEQDSTSGTTYPNPSVIMGVVGGLTPVADNSNLFGISTVVRDFAASFHVNSLGAVGGSSFWFGTSGKLLDFGYGVIGASYPDGAGNVGENWGVRGLATPGSAPFTFSGTVNHNKGGTFGSGGFSGTITSDYTVFLEQPATGATFTNPHEGLHIEDQTVGGILANAYGIHELGNALNDLGSGVTKAGTLQSTAAIFSAIGTCNSGNEGLMRAVTDSTTNTWGATITGSSTNHVLAYCDGTNWTVAAK